MNVDWIATDRMNFGFTTAEEKQTDKYQYPYQWSNTDDEIKHWLFARGSRTPSRDSGASVLFLIKSSDIHCLLARPRYTTTHFGSFKLSVQPVTVPAT